MSEIFFLSVMWIRIRTNLHYGRPPGSGSVWRMLIRIQELKSRQKMCQKVLKTWHKIKKPFFIFKIYFVKTNTEQLQNKSFDFVWHFVTFRQLYTPGFGTRIQKCVSKTPDPDPHYNQCWATSLFYVNYLILSVPI